MRIHKLLIPVLLAAALCACSRQDAKPEDTHENEKTAQTNRIEIPATVRNNLGITFANAERRLVDATIRIPGAFELQPLARHEYRMTLPGRVELRVDQYDRVEPGDAIYRYRSPEWPELQHEIIMGEQEIEAANAEIEVAIAKISETEQRASLVRDRLATLAEAEFRRADLEVQAAELEASLPRLRAELKQARTKLENARRTHEHALHRASTSTGFTEQELMREVTIGSETIPAYRTIDWIDVRAADSGIVESLALTDGAYAQAASLVLSIIDPTKLRFRAMALQADMLRLGTRIPAQIVPPATPGLDEQPIDATVTIGLEANPEQRTVTLLATPMKHEPWARAGVSAFLEVTVDSTSSPVIAIPRAAIVKDGIVHVFFRRDPGNPNKAIRVEADMGVSDGRWVEIKSGLTLNDQVVLDGAYELKLASQQSGTAQKGGHMHADGTFHEEH